MKKLTLILLTICTLATTLVCGCGSVKANGFDEKADAENTQIQTIDTEQNEPECPECPDDKKRDGECPTPRKPHKRHEKILPRPKYVYKKHH